MKCKKSVNFISGEQSDTIWILRKKVFYYLIIQTKLFAKFTSDKKDDFWFTLFKIFSDEKRMIFGIFKCVEKAIFMKSNCFPSYYLLFI